MGKLDGQYSGAALQAFVRGLERSQTLIGKILDAHGLARIDEHAWYPLATAQSIFRTIGAELGDLSLHAVGLSMIDSAPFPPEVNDVGTALSNLNAAYHMSVRGPDIGH